MFIICFDHLQGQGAIFGDCHRESQWNRHGSVEITDIRRKTGRIAQLTDQNELNRA